MKRAGLGKVLGHARPHPRPQRRLLPEPKVGDAIVGELWKDAVKGHEWLWSARYGQAAA